MHYVPGQDNQARPLWNIIKEQHLHEVGRHGKEFGNSISQIIQKQLAISFRNGRQHFDHSHGLHQVEQRVKANTQKLKWALKLKLSLFTTCTFL